MALALRSASAIIRLDGNPYEPDDDLLVYHRDLLARYDIEVDEDLMKQSRNIDFKDLAEELLDRFPEPITGPDLLVLAYGLPDRYPLRTVTAHLNHLLGGRSRSFAVSEQGLRSPFTALRIADAYALAGGAATLALFVCEQSTLPYRDPLVHDTPLLDSAALLYFGSGDGLRFVSTRAGGVGEPLAELLDTQVAALPPGPALVVAGPWTEPGAAAATGLAVHACQPGSYATSVWLDLARHHLSWADSYTSILLCDTDPRTGRSQVAVLHNTTAVRTGGEVTV
jgi:hypothetical protein